MSFINFNNMSELYEGKYSARVIAEALYSVETKNTKKIEATLSSVKEPVAISEALKFFSNKINALSALQVAKTNALPVNEGQFSWMTQDTGEQIGSERENRITVYMYDNEGNQWKEDKYDGYGEFGGMDYYELLAKMNGYSEEDLEEVKGPFKEMRQLGIDLAFGKLKTKDKGRKVLFPALVEDPRYNWKRHDFTQEPESDPNQSWYVKPAYDDEYDDEYYEAKTNEAKIVISKADMAKLHKEGKVEINGNVIEFVEEGLSWNSLIENINEAYMNDPVLVAFRAAKMKREKDMAKPKRKRKPLYGKQRTKAEDDLWQISQDLKDLYADRGQMLIDMEQDAEVEGGPIADEYGDKLNKIEDEIQALIAKRNTLEIRLAESVEIKENKEESLNRYALIENIDEEDLNERSINRIQKDWTKVTADMKDAVAAWKSAEGSEKEKMLAKLKELTAKKKSLEAELNTAVGLKDTDSELVGEARDPKSIQKEYADLKKLSKKDLQDTWSKSNKVGNPKELDKEGLISDILRSKYGNKYVDAAFESVRLSEARMQEIDKKVQKFVIKNANDYDYSNQDSAFQIYLSLKKLYPRLIKEAVNEADFGKPANGDDMSYGQLEKRGESIVESSVVTEAKTLDRDTMMVWVDKHLKTVRTSEEFDGTQGGIWVSGEDADMYKGMPIYDYYNEGSRKYNLGVLVTWEKELNKRGWYSEWYDAGTVMIWPN